MMSNWDSLSDAYKYLIDDCVLTRDLAKCVKLKNEEKKDMMNKATFTVEDIKNSYFVIKGRVYDVIDFEAFFGDGLFTRSTATVKVDLESKHPMKAILKIVPEIENVIFNEPATIVFWTDGTKTVVKANDEEFDPEKGLVMAIAKKRFGNEGNYYNHIKKWLPDGK